MTVRRFDGIVSEDRWKSYRKLAAEVKRHEEINDRLAVAERKKETKSCNAAYVPITGRKGHNCLEEKT